MEAFWDGLMKLLEHPTILAAVKTLLALWVAERMEFLARERRAHDLKAAEAIETGTALGHAAPHHAKKVMRESAEGQSVEFNSALDLVSPLLEPRVSTKRKIGRFLLKCLPLVSRFV